MFLCLQQGSRQCTLRLKGRVEPEGDPAWQGTAGKITWVSDGSDGYMLRCACARLERTMWFLFSYHVGSSFDKIID